MFSRLLFYVFLKYKNDQFVSVFIFSTISYRKLLLCKLFWQVILIGYRFLLFLDLIKINKN